MNRPFSGDPGEGQPQADTGIGGGGAPRTPVAVVCSDQAMRARLAMLVGAGTSAYGSMEELALVLDGAPVVAVLGPTFSDPVELNAAEQLLAARRDVAAVMVTDELSTDLLQRALRAGVKDVLQAPVESHDSHRRRCRAGRPHSVGALVAATASTRRSATASTARAIAVG